MVTAIHGMKLMDKKNNDELLNMLGLRETFHEHGSGFSLRAFDFHEYGSSSIALLFHGSGFRSFS